jgi:hypothetical protein
MKMKDSHRADHCRLRMPVVDTLGAATGAYCV